MDGSIIPLVKGIAKKAYLEGYKDGQDVENHSAVAIRSAETSFDRWWSKNIEQLERRHKKKSD